MPSTMRIYCMPFLSSWPNFLLHLPKQFLLPVFTLVSNTISNNCLNNLFVLMTCGGLCLFLDDLCFYAMSLLVSTVTCLCVTGMANIITVPYT